MKETLILFTVMLIACTPTEPQRTDPPLPAFDDPQPNQPEISPSENQEEKQVKHEENEDTAELQREINTLFNDGNTIGSTHYNRLKAEIEKLTNTELAEELQQKVDTISPYKEESQQKTHQETQESSCASNSNPVLTEHITDTDQIKAITPPRNEKTHSHVWIKDKQKVPVYLPVDATLAAGSKYNEQGELNYLLFFDVSCEVEIKFDHLEELVPEIDEQFPEPAKIDDSRTKTLEKIQFKAGDLIGHTTGTDAANNWDFGVYNKAKPNHLENNQNYEGLDTRANCPYDYFEEEMKDFYYNLFVSKTGSGAPSTDFCNN